MDTGRRMFLYIGAAISDAFCQEVFDVPNFVSIQDGQVWITFIVKTKGGKVITKEKGVDNTVLYFTQACKLWGKVR